MGYKAGFMNRTTREWKRLRAEMIGRLLPPIGSRMESIAAGGVSADRRSEIGSSRVSRGVRV
ncbi:hypothetical protein F2Q69_00015426 [Brassica cretica]|uniref:Uncharacterized protein n=1 Tax=Brassica cretica TaxID=69181 RepID=A0A8S9R0Z6_BRACR|nr:hypothetical protein F2Q69_00015426 [Brassica cretica]